LPAIPNRLKCYIASHIAQPPQITKTDAFFIFGSLIPINRLLL
jgi:hypothetical protein